ncbi:MAG TPA: type I-C CRISPR-associated protein Cas5 [Firmicutes bacterium]|nr:type I-C CRISPR-associated protein Cas5 [Bacillota bacterium]
MYEDAPLVVKLWGDFACFTRPEMKVERVSYPVPTPSAVRGALEAIFWKPEFRWRVKRIDVLNPIRYFSLLRNEVNTKAAVSSIKGWGAGDGYYADLDRAQRHTLALRDVAYLVWADVELAPHANGIDTAKYRDQFRRRVACGQCRHQPYLGCREFVAFFGPPNGSEQPFPVTEDLGLMLFDMDYASDGSGRGQPRFFPAKLVNGTLEVPQELYAGKEV